MVEVVEIGLRGVRSADIHPRNLCLDNDAERVAELERQVVVRIVREAKEIRSEFLDDAVVPADVSRGERRSLSFRVLMHRHPAERARTAVEEKSSLRIHLDGAVSHLGLGDVHHPLALEQFHAQGVEVRVLHSVPEVHS